MHILLSKLSQICVSELDPTGKGGSKVSIPEKDCEYFQQVYNLLYVPLIIHRQKLPTKLSKEL